MSPRFLDLLDKERQEIFSKLPAFSDSFTLAGGTAMMFFLGHRFSYDFDLFSTKSLDKNLYQKIKRVFGKYTAIKKVDINQYDCFTANSIKVTFVGDTPKSLLPVIKQQSVSLFQLDDLVANKAYTIGRRGAWRDYVDLFYVLNKNIYHLAEIISLASKKYQVEFNEKLFLEQLVYFEDVGIYETKFVKENFTVEEVKKFLERSVEEYLQKTLTI